MEEKLKIYCATEHFFGSIAKFLGDIGTVSLLPKNWEKIEDFKADLIVFSGGEDVDRRLYLPNEDDKSPKNKRDEWEMFILRSIISGKLKTNKVLGICRGLQLINVGLGGSLVEDIWEKYHESHKSFHEIVHRKRNVFQWLNMVNSMHHQGLERFGNSNKYPLSILATESRTGIVEIALWGNFLLGFQFHPEFFGKENPSQAKIAELLSEWTKGKLNLLENPPTAKVQEKSKVVYTENDLFRPAPEVVSQETLERVGRAAREARERRAARAERLSRVYSTTPVLGDNSPATTVDDFWADRLTTHGTINMQEEARNFIAQANNNEEEDNG